MKKWLACLLLIMIVSCKSKKPSLKGTDTVTVADFIDAFPLLTPPYTVADTNITKVADSTEIGYEILTQFIPDSMVNKIQRNEKDLVIYPVGKIQKTKELYLLATFTHRKKTKLGVFVLDKKNKCLAAKELLENQNEDDYSHFISINREPTFLISKEKMNADKQLMFSRVGWSYNSAGNFMVVINDGNEDPKKTSVINPIDTFPRKNKFSGNYEHDKKNYISLRDGKNPNTYLFFIHFEKNDGACTGELKGEMKFKNATTAVYTESGDPCAVDFTFSDNEITIKEKGSCGNRRGMQCFFDDTFTKKREPRVKKK